MAVLEFALIDHCTGLQERAKVEAEGKATPVAIPTDPLTRSAHHIGSQVAIPAPKSAMRTTLQSSGTLKTTVTLPDKTPKQTSSQSSSAVKPTMVESTTKAVTSYRDARPAPVRAEGVACEYFDILIAVFRSY